MGLRHLLPLVYAIIEAICVAEARPPSGTITEQSNNLYASPAEASTTPAPKPHPHDLLRRADTDYICGYNDYATLSCSSPTPCVGTVIFNGDAYLYCTTSGVPPGAITTTAYPYANGSSSMVCGESTACWYGHRDSVHVQVSNIHPAQPPLPPCKWIT
jgi:hypothetical protein